MFGLSELAQASRLDVGLAVFGGKEDRLDSETQARSLEAVVRLYPGENATRSLNSGLCLEARDELDEGEVVTEKQRTAERRPSEPGER